MVKSMNEPNVEFYWIKYIIGQVIIEQNAEFYNYVNTLHGFSMACECQHLKTSTQIRVANGLERAELIQIKPKPKLVINLRREKSNPKTHLWQF